MPDRPPLSHLVSPSLVLRVYRDALRRWWWLIERDGKPVQRSPKGFVGADEAHEQGTTVLKELRKLSSG